MVAELWFAVGRYLATWSGGRYRTFWSAMKVCLELFSAVDGMEAMRVGPFNLRHEIKLA
jgi:hypothetical protein